MRVLVLSHLFAHNTANTYRYWILSQHFSEKGYDVDVVGYKKLTSDKKLSANVRYFSVFSVLKLSTIVPLFIFTVIEFFKLLWFKKSYIVIKSGVLNGAVKLITQRLLRNNKYDLIIVSVVPWTYYSLIPYFKKHAPVLLDISDPLYKNAVIDTKQEGFEGCKKLEKNALESVDKIIVMSEPLLKLYEEELGIIATKIKFISPPVYVEHSFVKKRLVYNFSDSDVIKLLYAGTIYPGYRDAEEFVKAVQDNNKYYIEIISRIKKNSSSHIKYINWLSKQELFLKYEKCDILVFIDNFYGYQIPSKIFELLALQKPVLFIYDERNLYLYNLLKEQKGIFFIKNKASEIKKRLQQIQMFSEIEVDYDIDLSYYSDANMCHQFDLCISEILNL